MYHHCMTERPVTLDSLSVDAVFINGEKALDAFDRDVGTFVDGMTAELELLIADAAGTLLATRALARRIAINR